MSLEKELKTRFKNPYQKARINIHFTHNFLAYRANEMIKAYDLSASQFNVLRILRGQYPEANSVGLIKERMLDKSSDVSRIVDRLVIKKLIHRNECTLDRRQKDVIISQKGLDLLSKMDACEKKLDSAIKHLSLQELDDLNNLLNKIRNTEKMS
ncbi:MAG: MarR family transcriptional regulator [Flavobacteriaceae bacterium]|nr:MarR family transcriptional regulator [Flavobacteriaceae bacterium]